MVSIDNWCFANDHVLERIVGAMAHNGDGNTVAGNKWFPLTIGALRIPVGMTQEAINLFDNTQGDDYFFRMDAVCNAASDEDSIPNWHLINSKSKRKFSVGDTISFLASWIPNVTDSSVDVDIAINLRILWKLKI